MKKQIFPPLCLFSLVLGLLSPSQASNKNLIIQKGDAKAERVQVFNGVAKLGYSQSIITQVDQDPPKENQVLAPGGSIMDQKELEALWKHWKLGKAPTVDFTRQVVIANTWSGSGLHMLRDIDKEGNFMVICAGGTKDLVDGFTYLIEVYTLTGIQKVNGREWPKPMKNTERPNPE